MPVLHVEIGSDKPELPSVVTNELQLLMVQLGKASSLAKMVVITLASVRKVGLLLVQNAVEEREKKFRRSECPVICPKPKCETTMKRTKNLRAIRRFTLLGALHYRRCGYECPCCHAHIFPLDAELEIQKGLRGHSIEFASGLVLLCVVVPFGKGCELFSRLAGLAVSTHLARALTFDIGTRLFATEMTNASHLWAQRAESPEMFEPPPDKLRQIDRHQRVYVMTDNSKVGLQNGKRGRKAPRLKALLKQAQHERRQAARAAKRVTNGPAALPATNKDLETLLDDDGSWRDVRALLIFREEDLSQVSKTRREIVHRRVVAHLGTKEEWNRKNGMLIGSGAIESVHAWVIQARCRLPGMRWSEAGINAMLRLRCAWASGRWDENFASAAAAVEKTPRQIKAAA